MNKMKKILSILAAFICCIGISAQVDMTGKKFYIDMVSNKTTLSATVFDNANDYNFEIKLPDSNDKVDAAEATVNVMMKNVASLGVGPNDIHSTSSTIKTGSNSVLVALGNWMPNIYNFTQSKCNVKVIDTDKSYKDYIYDISKTRNIISGTTKTPADARAAWNIITSHVTPNSKESNTDSRIDVMAGTYVIVGNERIDFNSDVTLFGNNWTPASEVAKIQKVATVSSISTNDYSGKVFIYLPVGSKIILGSCSATLKAKAKITFDFSASGQTLNSMISTNLRKMAQGNSIQTLIGFIDELVGAADGYNVNATVDFSDDDMNGLKFYADMTSNGTTLSFSVFDNSKDYNFELKLPDSSAKVNAAEATINVKMHNIASLGVGPNEVRSTSSTIKTGSTPMNVQLSSWMPNTYSFQGANCDVKVIDIDESYKDFTYAITKNGNTISGSTTPSDASAAWKIITSHVTANSATSNTDSKLDVKAGTYVIIGNERIDFNSDVTLFDNNWTPASELAKIQKVATISAVSNNKFNSKVFIFLPVGSTLNLGSSSATLNAKAKITFDYSATGKSLNGTLSNILNGMTPGKNAMQSLIETVDMLVGAADGYTVKATVDFSDPVIKLTVYPGSETAVKNQTVDQFKNTQKTKINAIAIAEEKYADAVAEKVALGELYNVVVEYAAGNNGNHFYECEELILTDTRTVIEKYASSATADYYSPVTFTAISGNFKRGLQNSTETCCLPFDFKPTTGKGQILTYAYYKEVSTGSVSSNPTATPQEAYVYLNKRDVIKAGDPFFFYNGDSIKVEFNNTTIVGTPDNSANLQGAFITTGKYNDGNHYGINNKNQKIQLMKVNGNVLPFRCCLSLKYDTDFNGGSNHTQTSGAKLINICVIGEDGEATAIDGTKLDIEVSKSIYTINGTKVNSISKPGLYIIDGKKVLCK